MLIFKKNESNKIVMISQLYWPTQKHITKNLWQKKQLGMILVFIQPYLSVLNSLEFIWKNINESRFQKTSWISYGKYRVVLSEYTELAKSELICK